MKHCNLLYRLYLLCLLCTLQVNVTGQTVETYTGEKVFPSDLGSFQLFSFDSTRLFAFRVSENQYYLQSFSRDSLKSLSIIKIPLPSKDSIKFHLENLFVHSDYFQIFYSYFDKENKRENLDMMNFSSSGEMLGQTKTIEFSLGKNERKAGDFSVTNRPISNEFISYSFKQVKGNVKINKDHFDYNGNKLRSDNFDLLDNPNDIVYFTSDSSGEMIITKDYYSSITPNWKIKIYPSEFIKPFTLVLKKTIGQKRYLSERFYSFIDASGNITFITPYSTSRSLIYTEGVYLVKIDQARHLLLREEFIPFKQLNTSNETNEDFSLSYCIITNILQLPDNTLNVIFESRLVRDYHTYEIGNILSAMIDSCYQLTGICRIDKKQKVEKKNHIYTGFNILHKDNKCFFIFNELAENLALKEGEPSKKIKNSKVDDTAISIFTVENNEITERKALIEKDNSGFADALLPNETLYTDRHEMYSVREQNEQRYLMKFYIKSE